jgi:hypothetical protein
MAHVYDRVTEKQEAVNEDIVRENTGIAVTYELRENHGSAQFWAKFEKDGTPRECHLLSIVPGYGIVLQPGPEHYADGPDPEVFLVDDEGYCVVVD